MVIDIILPLYNPSHYVYESIESVVAQSYDNWLLHIADDASRHTSHIDDLKKRYGKNERIKFYQLRNNIGAPGVRNHIINKCSGDLVAFLDQDDIWISNKLELQVDQFRTENVSASHGDILFINDKSELIKSLGQKENFKRKEIDWSATNDVINSLLRLNTIRLVSAVVNRKDFLESGGFNSELFGGEDGEFWIRFGSRYKIGHVKSKLIKRRIHDVNTSTYYKSKRVEGQYQAMELLLAGKYKFDASSIRIRYYSLTKDAILSYKRENKINHSLKCYLQYLVKYPFSIFSVARLFGILLFK